MTRPLRLLLVEDLEDDAQLLIRELTRQGFAPQWRRVDSAESMRAALAQEPWDVVISDFNLPSFSAPSALGVLQASGIDVPFLIVSGTVGEETAVEVMRSGAHDFLLKGRLTRLGAVLLRELREAELRREQTQLREKLILTDRMASIGLLAAGVAHEVNNPLAALIGNLDYVLQELAHYEQAAALGEPLRDCLSAAQRIRQIIRDIKTFTRVEEEQREMVDVRAVLESALRMASLEIRHRARVVKNYGEVPPVDGNEGRMSQVFLNLIVNAAHAMDGKEFQHNELRVVTRSENGHVIVEVADTGSGMAAEIRDRIFEPFFTTKPVGQGTGLGLAICDRIVRALGGRMEVESQVGKGSTFRVWLRASAGVRPASVATKPSTGAGRRGRILVIDDEAAIGNAIRRVLAPSHDVAAVHSSSDALVLLRTGERFDIILCDLMMPTMSGIELHEEIQRQIPDQAERMIFLTGGAFTAPARDFVERMQGRILEKPFESSSLRQVVAERLT